MYLLDLPEEILSLILSQLPLADLIPLSLSCRALRNLCSTGLSPFPTVINDALDVSPSSAFSGSRSTRQISGPKCSIAHLATLGCYSHVHSRSFLPLLIRAPLPWILDECQIPRLRGEEWKEAFEGRFLPSWRRGKHEGESWRACYLRTVRHLLHRQTGCSHEEVWTRFLMLNRNGSASLNRLYSRGFDPIASFEEIKHQHALSAHQTHARLVLRLQDVRIIAIGVRAPPSSVWVNRNAFTLLHPPGLREWESPAGRERGGGEDGAVGSASGSGKQAEGSRSGELSTARFTIKEEDVAGSSQIRRDRLDARSGPSTAETTDASRSTGTAEPTVGLRRLLRTRSRGMDAEEPSTTSASSVAKNRLGALNPRRWSIGARTTSDQAIHRVRSPEQTESTHAANEPGLSAMGIGSESTNTAVNEQIVASETVPSNTGDEQIQSPAPGTTPAIQEAKVLPYRSLRRPLPAATHRLYPNYTPFDLTQPGRGGTDRRATYETGMAPGAFYYGPRTGSGTAERDLQDKMVDVEVDEDGSVHTWVGPMLLLAQLNLPFASATDIDGPVSPAQPSLGPTGSFVNLEWEDLEVIAPWISLQGDDGGELQAGQAGGPGGYGIVEARRDGLGFGQ